MKKLIITICYILASSAWAGYDCQISSRSGAQQGSTKTVQLELGDSAYHGGITVQLVPSYDPRETGTMMLQVSSLDLEVDADGPILSGSEEASETDLTVGFGVARLGAASVSAGLKRGEEIREVRCTKRQK